MKARINISIDVTKIDKERLKMGKKRQDGTYGKYLSLTTFVDTTKESKYGDHGFIAEQITLEEKEAGIQGSILGNSKVVWQEDGLPPSKPQQESQSDFQDDDIPFQIKNPSPEGEGKPQERCSGKASTQI